MDHKIKKVLLAIAISSLAAGVDAAAPGAYFGMDFGVSNSHNKNQTIITGTGTGVGNLSVPGNPATVNTTPSNKGLGIRLFMGYNINRYAAFEGGFDHYASTTYNSVNYTTIFPPYPNKSTQVNLNPGLSDYGIDLELKGMLPIGDNFNAFVKGGFGYIRQTLSGSLLSCGASNSTNPCSTVTRVSSSSNTNALRPLVGFGMAYDFSQNWEGDVSYTRITSGNGIQNMDFMSLGFAYHAVDLYCGQFLC